MRPCSLRVESSATRSGISSGGGFGGSLKITEDTQDPLVIGCDRNGPDVITITAPVVMTPPYLLSLNDFLVKSISRKLTLMAYVAALPSYYSSNK